MLYHKEKKLVILAVPKTATSSLRELLLKDENVCRNQLHSDEKTYRFAEHDSLRTVESMLTKEEFKEIQFLACVRNPWDRMVSAYHFYRNGRAWKQVKAGKLRKPRAVLNVWLARIIPFSIWLLLRKPASCTHYLVNKEGVLKVDYVIKLEELNTAFPSLCQRLGIKLTGPLPRENVSIRKDYRTYYSWATRRIVEWRYRDDIENFGYSFE